MPRKSRRLNLSRDLFLRYLAHYLAHLLLYCSDQDITALACISNETFKAIPKEITLKLLETSSTKWLGLLKNNPTRFLYYMQAILAASTKLTETTLPLLQETISNKQPTIYGISTLFPHRFSSNSCETILLRFSNQLRTLIALLYIARIFIDKLKPNHPATILFRLTIDSFDQEFERLRFHANFTASTSTSKKVLKIIIARTAMFSAQTKKKVLILAAGFLLTSPNQPTLPTPAEDHTLAPAISESPYIAELLAKKYPYYLSIMKDEFRDNPNIMLKAIQNNPDTYLLASQRLQKTKEYALQAAKVCPQTLQHMHINFQTDWDIFLAALDTANDLNILEYLPPRSKIRTKIEVTLKRESGPLTAKNIFDQYYYMHSSRKFSMPLG